MTETGTSEAVTSYLTSLRAALADLPPAEVEEILDDIGPHVAEVATELMVEGDATGLDERLHDRLGRPEQYATELRAAAGYPPRPDTPAEPAGPGLGGLRLAFWLLAASVVLVPLFALTGGGASLLALLLAAVPAALSLAIVLRHPGGIAAFSELPEVRRLRARTPGGAVAEYGRLLQPGWWLVRAGVAALLVVVLFGTAQEWLLLVVAVPMVLGSVWLGRRSQTDRRWLWAVLPLNALAVVAALGVLSRLPIDRVSYVDYGGGDQGVIAPKFGNIYPYDSDGRPLTGVYLYDESGQPIVPMYPAGDCLPTDRVPVPANQYPQPVYRLDAYKQYCVLQSVMPSTPPGLPTASATAPPTAPPSSAPPASTVPPPSAITPTSAVTPTS